MADSCTADNSGPFGRFGRRRLIAGGTATATLAAAGSMWHTPIALAADDFVLLRQRWRDLVTSAAYIDPANPRFTAGLTAMEEATATVVALVDRSSSRTRVFTDQSLARPADSASAAEKLAAIRVITSTFTRLRALAIAWYTPGTKFHQDESLIVDVVAGLKTVGERAYNVNTARWANWWNFDIAIPERLVDIMVLMHDHLSAADIQRYSDAIQRFLPDPLLHNGEPKRGANAISPCSIAMVEALSTEEVERFNKGASILPEVCRYVTGDDGDLLGVGLWADGSYLHHTLPYTGSYGEAWLADMGKMATLLVGTDRELGYVDPYKNLFDAVDRAFLPLLHDGRMMSFVNGRAAAVTTSQEDFRGMTAMMSILRLARLGVVDEATAQRWRERCLGGMRRSPRDFFDTGNLERISLFDELDKSGVSPAAEPDGSVVFHNAARAVHRRDGWAFAIAMNSDRIDRYESISGEHLQGWHTGEGMTYLYDSDKTQYMDEFWPTVDPKRLAGTTMDGRPLPKGKSSEDGRTPSPFKWAGGASVDGYSAVGMSLHSGYATDPVIGKKAWFCFDDVIYCMGRSIVGGGGNNVETIVENRNLHKSGTNKLVVNGAEWGGSSETMADPKWAHLEGVGGYIFPSSANPTVRFKRETRTGSWRDIWEAGATDAITSNYLSMAVQHGKNPTDGLYKYLIVPGATAEETRQLAENSPFSTVAHNVSCHAVQQASAGVTMYNFLKAHTLGSGAGVNSPCSVIVIERDGKLSISTANPLRGGNKIRVTVPVKGTGYTLDQAVAGITVVSIGATIVLDVATGTLGDTFTARFSN